MRFGWCLLCWTLGLLAVQATDPGLPSVLAKFKPTDSTWREQPTRTLAQMKDFSANDPECDKWGGWAGHPLGTATGYFQVARAENGRWWFVDPEGNRFLHVGMCSVYPGKAQEEEGADADGSATTTHWAAETLELLRANHFNGLGGWTQRQAVGTQPQVLPYALSLNFIGEFARSLSLTRHDSGHIGFAGGVPPIFHPEFPAWCARYADKHLKELKEDPMILGYFSDNELPFNLDYLDHALALDASDPALAAMRQHALDWLKRERGKPVEGEKLVVNEEDRSAYLAEAVTHYTQTVAGAIRAADPHHLYLGCRFHGRALRQPGVFKSAGAFLDVISVNYYHAWTPKAEDLALWSQASGRPVLITEFYAKGADSGLDNTTGAGWLVKTQEDRGKFYQNFTLALLEARNVVGWHWFKLQDSAASNQGVLNKTRQPYAPLLDAMNDVNRRVYPVTGYFDAAPGP